MRPAAASLALVLGAGTLLAAPEPATAAELAEAAEHGDHARIDTLLASADGRAMVDEPAGYGMTALLYAVQANDLELSLRLLDAGADPNRGNLYEITPLWLAATNRSPAMIELLLAHGADAGTAMSHGENAVMAAARAGDAESIRLLLAAGADPDASEQLHGETALIWAAAENHGAAVRALVAGGADPDRQSRVLELAPMDWIQIGMVSTILPVGGWSPLMYAARQNAAEAALALLEVGADPDLRDADGTTALGLAIMNQHYDLAAALLEAGADPDVADRTGMTSLYGAVDMVFYTSDIGRPRMPRYDRLTATDIVRLALEHGADPNAQLSSAIIGRHHGFGDFALGDGATALMRAAKGGDLEVMRLLLDAGADPGIAMANGATVLNQIAGGRGAPPNTEALALLAEYGVVPDEQAPAPETDRRRNR